MLKSFKYRIYPTKEQEVLLKKHIGCVRFIYNLALETKQAAFASSKRNLTRYDLQSQLKDLKNDLVWLKEINSQTLQVVLKNLDAAYLSFFKGKTDFPSYKKKRNSGSFSIPQNVSIKDNKIVIPKFKEGIKIVISRPIIGIIKHANITRTATGKYFASIVCDTREEKKTKSNIKENTTVGIDLGIKSFLVTSNGETFENPKFLRKSLSKLKFTQSKHSKYKGKRTNKKLSLLHEKVANQRKDFLHKVSTKIIRENQSIAIEDLNIKGMIANHKLSMSISDCGLGMFVYMLEYKADWYGKNILKIGRFDPSSKTCSVCGNINRNLSLKDREWCCDKCHTIHDRDLNAAKNIKNFALAKLVSGVDTKNHVELLEMSRAMTHEVNN